MIDALKAVANFLREFGVPITFAVFIAAFVWFGAWPWFTKRIELRDAKDDKRNQSYVDAIQQSAVAIERSTQVISRLVERVEAQPIQRLADLITQHMERTDAQHGTLIDKVDAIDRKLRG